MRKFKYLINTIYEKYDGLTSGKVYDLISYISSPDKYILDKIIIINDFGSEQIFYIADFQETKIFEEVTLLENRNEQIDYILN